MAKATENKIKVSELIPDDKNFNKGSEFGQGLIEKSFEKFGAGRSILIDKNNKIIAGNKSTENYGALGGQDVIVVESDGKQLIAVKRTDIDLDTPQGREMALADNATAKANIVWAEDIIAEEIGVEVAESWGIDMGKEIPEAEEDDFDTTPPEEPITVLGDLYEIGEHRLLCGDSTDSDQVEKLMNGNKADMVFTDPPYGMFLDTNYDQMFANDKNHKKTGERFDKVKGDHNDFVPELINTIFACFNDTKEIFIWGADYFAELIPDRINGSWVVWDKRCDENMDKVSGNTFELCWSKQKHKRLVARILWSGHHGMHKDDTKTRVHPTQKPIKLASFFFENWGKEGDLVADVFLGSGTTMVASHQLNRKCYGMELDQKYCDVIVRRMLKLDPTLVIKRNGEITTDFNNA